MGTMETTTAVLGSVTTTVEPVTTTTMIPTTTLLGSNTTTGYQTTTELLGSVTTTAEADTTATMNTTTAILGVGTTTMDTTTAILGSGTTTNYETTTAVPTTTTEVVCSQQKVCRVVNTCASSAFSTGPHQVPAASNLITSAANRQDDVVCNGCNCAQTIVLSRGDATTITSPEFDSNHRNRAACSWKINTKTGRLRLFFPEFDLESGADCSKEYLQMDGPVQDHGRPRLCGNNVPDGTSFESKYHTFSLKFVSNRRRRKSGFKAEIVAI